MCFRAVDYGYEASLVEWDAHIQKRDFETILSSKDLFMLTLCDSLSKELADPCKVFEGRVIKCYLPKGEFEYMQGWVEVIRNIFLNSFLERREAAFSFRFKATSSPHEFVIPWDFFWDMVETTLPRLADTFRATCLAERVVVPDGVIGVDYKIAWPHANRLAETLYSMSSYAEGCDLKIVSIQNTPFYLHSFLLHRNSGSFLEVFAKKRVVALENSDFVLQIFIDYLYVGRSAFTRLEDKKIPHRPLFEMYHFAKQYNLPEMWGVARYLIKKSI